MKRYFVKTNGFDLVLFVDKKNKAYVIDEQAFDEPLTLATAKIHDYGNLENCETAHECVECMGFGDIVDFNADEFEELIEF